ncbi:MAG: hypothetical protein EBT84_13135, partial [Sphingomonadaceae bacterium]|nr:hypothetical protein [Sphingomonadaceae bacterium]
GTAQDGFGRVDTLISIENIRTGSGNDVAIGSSADNRIVTNAGRDSISAGSGNDTVFAGAGDDVVLGESGNDSIDAGEGNDSVNAGAGSDTVRGGAGNDTLVGGSGTDWLDYSDQSNGIIVNLSSSTYQSVLSGTADDGLDGIDSISGFEGIIGSTGRDTLLGGGGNTLDGGLGSDILIASSAGDAFIFDAADISIVGGAGTDTLIINDEQVDFTPTWAMPNISGINTISMGAEAPQIMVLDQAAVFRMAGTNALTLLGSVDDKAQFTDLASWTYNAGTRTWSSTYATGSGNASLSVIMGAGLEVITTNAVASGGDDTLTGTAASNTLSGGDGNDVLFGYN